jgi:hypothetical protein
MCRENSGTGALLFWEGTGDHYIYKNIPKKHSMKNSLLGSILLLVIAACN